MCKEKKQVREGRSNGLGREKLATASIDDILQQHSCERKERNGVADGGEVGYKRSFGLQGEAQHGTMLMRVNP